MTLEQEMLLKDEGPKFKFLLGEKVVEKEGGFFYTNPFLWISGFNTEDSSRHCGTIIDRKRVGEYNWYRFSNYGNWITEEGLEYKESTVGGEDLLEKARTLYPKGTRYICAAGRFTTPETVERAHQWVGESRDKIEAGLGYIYYEGKWAQIIEEEKKKKEGFSYKVGDWIIANSLVSSIYGTVLQIDRVEPYDNNTYKIYAKRKEAGSVDWFNSSNIIRRAFPYEIPVSINPSSLLLTEAFGMSIGDTLKEEDLNAWVELYYNYISPSHNTNWRECIIPFMGDRKIEAIKEQSGHLAFLVSGTHDIWIRAEGYKQFCDNRKKNDLVAFRIDFPIWKPKYLENNEKRKDYNIGMDPYFNTRIINKRITATKKIEDVSGYIQQAVVIKEPKKSSIISV